MWFLKPLGCQNWITIVAAALFGVGSGACTAGLLAMVTEVLKDGTAIDRVVVFFVLLVLGRVVSTIAARIILVRFAQRAVTELRISLCKRILATPLRQIETIGIGEIYSALTTDSQTIRRAIRSFPNLLVNAAIVLGCSVYLAWLAWYPFLITASVIGLGAASYWPIARRAIASLRESRRATSDLHEKIRSLTDGIKELKLHPQRREDFLSKGLAKTLEIVRRHAVSAEIHFSIAQSWTQLLFFTLIGLLLYFQPGTAMSDSGNMIGFILTVVYLLSPLSALTSLVSTFSPAQVALQRIEALHLALEPAAETVPAHDTRQLSDWRSLSFRDVTFRYTKGDTDRHFVLGPINLSLCPGELLFLVGGNGSGKTTLAKVLVGLYLPESGEITLDGTTIDAGNIGWFQQCFSTVFSDFHVFKELYGLSGTSIQASCADWLQAFGLRRDVSIERGEISTIDLSRGQTKRLALLVALLEDRPIYVFDEWAADQDTSFRDTFYTEILPSLREQGRTVIVISHDERYFHLADRTVRLEDGQIVEDINNLMSDQTS